MDRLVGRLAEIGAIRDDLDREKATDLMFVLISHDTYRGLVQQAGWTLPDYKAWLFTTLTRQLFRPGEPSPGATSDLSFHHLLPRPGSGPSR